MSNANIKIFTALNPELLEDAMNDYFGNLDEDYEIIGSNYVFNSEGHLYSSMVIFNTIPHDINEPDDLDDLIMKRLNDSD